MSPTAESISSILGPLYEAAASPGHWPVFFEALRQSIGVDKGFFVLTDPRSACNLYIGHEMDPASQRAYLEHYYLLDVLGQRFMAAKQAHGEWVGTSQSVIPDREYQRSVIFNELAKPQGMGHQCGVSFDGLDGGAEGGLSIYRHVSKKPFDSESIALLAMLTPHFKRALNIHRLLSQEREDHAVLRQTLEKLDLALISVNSRGSVLRTTESAREILERRDGLGLDRGYLRAAAAGEQRQLSGLLTGAVATGSGKGTQFGVRQPTTAAPEARAGALWTAPSGGAMLISRQPPGRPLQLVVTPFYSSEILLDERPAALIFLSDPDAHPASRKSVLRALYELTPAECRMAGLLAAGNTIADAANVMRISTLTARTHLKAIFRKTGTNRQAELVRLVLGLPGESKPFA